MNLNIIVVIQSNYRFSYTQTYFAMLRIIYFALNINCLYLYKVSKIKLPIIL